MKNSILFITSLFKSLFGRMMILVTTGIKKLQQFLGVPNELNGGQLKNTNFLMRRILVLAGVVLVLILGIYFLMTRLQNFQGAQNHDAIPVYEVKKSKFENKIVERGTLKALRSLMFSSEIPGNAGKVVKMAQEGTFVKTGDMLVEFDQTQFASDIEKFRTEVQKAKAELIQAEESMKAEKIKGSILEKTAENDLTNAELELKSFRESKGPLMISKARAAVEKTQTELERTSRNFNAMKDMLKEGYITLIEMEQEESKFKEARNNHEFAKQEHELMTKFSYPSELESAKTKVDNARESIQKTKESIQSSLASKEAGIQMAHANLLAAESHVATAQDMLRRTTRYAPIDGFVVYKTIELPGGEKKRVQIGDSVWQGQEVLYIPDMSKMLIETRIREVDIYKIKVGQKAEVKFDAFPDLTVKGHVSLIGTLAKSDSGKGGIKYFTMEIELDITDKRLRPGMTARSEILVYEQDNAIAVPVDAVFEKGGKKICYVVAGGSYATRGVVTGMSNENFVLIKEGLREGEKILLAEPSR